MLRKIRYVLVGFLFLAVAQAQSPAETTRPDHINSEYLTSNELLLFRQSLSFIKDEHCRRDLNETLWGLLSHSDWAATIYDSSIRNSFGTKSGITYHFGHYDQCLNVNDNKSLRPVLPMYCLVNVTKVNGESPNKDGLLNTEPSHWGECVPASCSPNDIEMYLQHTLQRHVKVDEKRCQTTDSVVPITFGMSVYAYILIFIVFLNIVGTFYHMCSLFSKRDENSEKETGKYGFLLSFSIIENMRKLFSATKENDGLSSLHGVKVIALMSIIMGHTFLFIYGIPLYNMGYITESLKQVTYGYLVNSMVFTDTFLILSGFLCIRLLLPLLEQHQGRINVLILYIGRFIRITPAYMVMIFFYATWFLKIGDGPLWQERISREEERCQSSWWLNLLYVNNYFNTDKLCMFQSWYLAADTQLFYVAPVLTYLLYKFRKYGINLMVLLILITLAIPFVLTYLQEWEPTVIIEPKLSWDISDNVYFENFYIKTHVRASAYFIGLLAGYLSLEVLKKRINISRFMSTILWVLCIAGLSSMLFIYRFHQSHYTNIESTLYAGFHRLCWNLANAWLVIALTTGRGGWLTRCLSSNIFVPLSRLTYCAFLCNGLVELYNTSNIRVAQHFDFIEGMHLVFIRITDTFILALPLCLMFESPMRSLKLNLFGSSTKTKNLKEDKVKSSNAGDI